MPTDIVWCLRGKKMLIGDMSKSLLQSRQDNLCEYLLLVELKMCGDVQIVLSKCIT